MEELKVGDVLYSSSYSGRVGKKIVITNVYSDSTLEYEVLESHKGFENYGFNNKRFFGTKMSTLLDYKKDSLQINPHFEPTCFHNWKEEYYFSAKPFKTCTKCQAKYEDT